MVVDGNDPVFKRADAAVLLLESLWHAVNPSSEDGDIKKTEGPCYTTIL
jgi:hypothetical protein